MNIKELLSDKQSRPQLILCAVLLVLIIVIGTWLAVQVTKAAAYVKTTSEPLQTEAAEQPEPTAVIYSADDDEASAPSQSPNPSATFTPLPTVEAYVLE
ncbi:MAG: hypothetical protein PUF72_04205 [Clostridiales bacterium]|nr:hypothetical protein [Clostridiales bacterium]